MVARRVGRDAFGRFFLAQGENRIAGAPKLESAHLLKIFAFKKDLRPNHLIQAAACEDWRSVGIGLNPLRGFLYLLQRKVHGFSLSTVFIGNFSNWLNRTPP
jgi:hypothetical protein